MAVFDKIKRKVSSLIGGVVSQVTGTTLPSEETRVFPEGIAELARESASSGIVLLKNDGVLPLFPNTKIALFGRCQYDYFYVGYGSGGDVFAPYKTSPIQALKNDGSLLINSNLLSVYAKWREKNPPLDGFWGHWPYNYEEMPITDELALSVAKESDVAVVFIGRSAGEDRENILAEGSYYLTETEKDMLKSVTEAFNKTVVILDCGNIIDLSWIKKYKISALLYAWQGGMESCNALVDILTGKVNPSGKLTDTIAKKYKDYPSSKNFGNRKYNYYTEDIYVGYRYFETFKPKKVLYPFGFGLSYTSFSINVQSFFADGFTATFSVEVTNTGIYEGKEVVQIYLSAPCGKLGKPTKVLVDFKKTPLLKSGENCKIGFSIPYYAMSSYDDSGVTGNKSCYVMENGKYELFVGNSVKCSLSAGSFIIPETQVLKTCEKAMAPVSDFQRLIAHECDGEIKEKYVPVPKAERLLKQRIINSIGKEITYTGDKGYKFNDVLNGKISLDDFVAQLNVDELRDICCGEGKMCSILGAKGNAGAMCGVSESLRAKGIPPIITTDGPSGLRLVSYATLIPCGTCLASTWDTVLIEKLTELLGKEMIIKGSHVLLAPGLNIHRNPLCGRNFEYFSEDPVVSGQIAGAYVRGIQKNGVSACPKHFACNNQETNRTHNDSRVSERALREIYLKGFEICINISSPMTIMTSYNKINGVWSHYNFDLCETILRKEFGYEGMVMTDWWMRKSHSPEFKNIYNNSYRVRAGVDVLMPGSISHFKLKMDNSIKISIKKGALSLAEAQASAKRVLNLAIKLFAKEK